MRASNDVYLGPLSSFRTVLDGTTDSFGNPTPPVVTQSNYEGIRLTKVVSCPPMNRGDHVNPTAWNYTVIRNERGVATRVVDDYEASYPPRSDYSIVTSYSSLTANDSLMNECLLEAEDKAISRLYDKLRGGIDLSIDAFQARQTARMFTASENIEKFASKLPLLRKGGGIWLAYQYGWKPLLSTIYDVAEESLRWHINKINRLHASGSVQAQESVKVPPWSGSFNGRDETIKIKAFAKVRYGAYYRQTNDFSLARYTSLNPVSIVWELLPYSFVVDWMVDVGGFLRNAETAALYQKDFVKGYKTIVFGQTQDWKHNSEVINKVGNRRVISSNSASSAYRSVNFSRTILQESPYPSPPRFSPSLGAERLISAASLLSQFLGKR